MAELYDKLKNTELQVNAANQAAEMRSGLPQTSNGQYGMPGGRIGQGNTTLNSPKPNIAPQQPVVAGNVPPPGVNTPPPGWINPYEGMRGIKAPNIKGLGSKIAGTVGKSANILGNLYAAAETFSQPSNMEAFVNKRAEMGDPNAHRVIGSGGGNPILEGIKRPIRNAVESVGNAVSDLPEKAYDAIPFLDANNNLRTGPANQSIQPVESKDYQLAKSIMALRENEQQGQDVTKSPGYAENVINKLYSPETLQSSALKTQVAGPDGKTLQRLMLNPEWEKQVNDAKSQFTPEQQAQLNRIGEGFGLERKLGVAAYNSAQRNEAIEANRPFQTYLDQRGQEMEQGVKYADKMMKAERDNSILPEQVHVTNLGDGDYVEAYNPTPFQPHAPSLPGPGYARLNAPDEAQQNAYRRDENGLYAISGPEADKNYRDTQKKTQQLSSPKFVSQYAKRGEDKHYKQLIQEGLSPESVDTLYQEYLLSTLYGE